MAKKPTQKEEIAMLRRENERLQAKNSELANREPAPVDALAHVPPAAIAGINETATALAAATAKANVEARFLVALNRPRNLDAVRVELLKDCRRPNFAEVAIYERPVGGGKTASGPSIRFAESAARAFGNLNIDARTIYESDEKRIISVNVTNLESNVTYGVEITINKTVERRKLKEGQTPISLRTNSTGQTVYKVEATEDDMLQKTNSLTSKAMRNSIIRHLQGDLVDEALRQCRRTLQDQQSQDPDAARKRIVDGFAALNVPIKELNDLLGHDIAAASPKEMDFLRGVFTTVREGDASWAEVLAVVREERGEKPGSSGSRSADIKSAIAERARRGANGAATPGNQPAGEQKTDDKAPKSQGESAGNPEESQAAKDGEQAARDIVNAESERTEPTGEVAPENEPTDEDLKEQLSQGENTPDKEPAENAQRLCPEDDCDGILEDDPNEPGYLKCPKCLRWVKK